MTQEEILQYNKRCAEFLGAINLGKKGYSNLDYYEHDLFLRSEWSNKYQDNIDIDTYTLTSMIFHLDWNWIMEVLDKIENHLKMHTVTSQGITGHYININRDISIIHSTLDNPSKFMGSASNKKEANIKAINQFLIWHEQNK